MTPVDPVQPRRVSPFDPHIWMWLVVIFAAYHFYTDQVKVEPDLIAYSEFKAFVRQGNVRSVTFKHDQVRGQYLDESNETKSFVTTMPSVADDELLPLLEENQVRVEAATVANPLWLQLLMGKSLI
jgi:cell division protease FtsH